MVLLSDVPLIPPLDLDRSLIINLILDPLPDIRSMKPLTAKQSEIAMRFFTPDLYLRFNSNDDEIADQANDEWEKAIDSYQRYLKKLNLPESVKKLTEINLHDAELSDFQEVDLHQTVMSLKNNQYVYCLIYQTTNLVRKDNFPQNWLFSDQRKHFLYDELDLQDSAFLHRILWSDGEILEIPFTFVTINPINGFTVENVVTTTNQIDY